MFLLSFSAFAQSALIRGKALDAATNEPLANASVLLKPSLSGFLTDKEGNFELQAKPTDVTIQVSFIGYETASISLSSVKEQVYVTVKMRKIYLPSQSILVSASMMESDAKKSNYTRIDAATLQKSRANEDVPEMLSSLPSTQWYSEGGAGNGYNYLSIRGFDQRRIAVMVNGIPQNDPEDHNVYWIDFSDVLGSTEVIKIQRGTGGAVFGYPAIGGAINIVTSSITATPEFNLAAQQGSFGLRKYAASYSTGLIDKKYAVQAKFSQTTADGYRDLSSTTVNSYYLSLVRMDENLISQVNFYGGPFEDRLVYTGLPKFAVFDKDLRKKNYSYWEADAKSFSYVTERRAEECEQYTQPHFELLNDLKLSDKVTLNSALFMVIGSGYYDYDGSWAPYSYYRFTPANGFASATNPDSLIANAIIRAEVDNRQWGWLPRIKIKLDDQEFNAGLEIRFHRSNHWGALNSGNGAPQEAVPDFHYYDYHAGKDMLGAFVNDTYSLSDDIKLLGELQVSYTKYLFQNEKFIGTEFTVPNVFLNPKVGLNYTLSPSSSLFFTAAIVGREPRLSNYYDAAEASDKAKPQFEQRADGSYDFSNPLVKPERMFDFELGYTFSTEKLNASLNVYVMSFRNEIVKNGGVNRFGEATTGNIDRTRHAGVELSLRHQMGSFADVIANAAFSRSTIQSGAYYSTDDNKFTYKVDLAGNRITDSPDFIGNFGVALHAEGAYLELTCKYVSSFYSDNFDSKIKDVYALGLVSYEDNKNDAYFTAKLLASYSFSFKGFSGETKVYAQVNNLFDRYYSAYAVGKEFFPAAERSFVLGLTTAL